mmetsp:Transcript_63462/g.177608  ORF Transcript_63462/g.177608 Transcript_63462/m.177608 type:complete len:260 (+) Transcript_63462:257-1036(+)
MLDAAAEGQLDDGAPSATRRRPRDHTCTPDAAPGHGRAEDPWEAGEEGRPAAAWEASSMPASCAADLPLEAMLETRAVAGVVHEVDVEDLHAPVPGRVHDESTMRPAAARASHVHPLIVVPDVPGVDVLDAGACAPHLVSALAPTTATLEEWEQLRGVPGEVAAGEVALGKLAHIQQQRAHVCSGHLLCLRTRSDGGGVLALRLSRVLRHNGGEAPSQPWGGAILGRRRQANKQGNGNGPHRPRSQRQRGANAIRSERL